MFTIPYIKMSREAKEIQENWKKRELDRITDIDGTKQGYLTFNTHWIARIISSEDFLEEYIWLPRVDQLQEMLICKYPEGQCPSYKFRDMVREFYEFVEIQFNFYSMEELWLGFVMGKLYNKIWNGQDWEPIDLDEKVGC